MSLVSVSSSDAEPLVKRIKVDRDWNFMSEPLPEPRPGSQFAPQMSRTGKSSNCRHISSLAIEWLEQIVQLLDLKQVFVVKRVCREWLAASQRVIAEWPKLDLFCGFPKDPRNTIIVSRKGLSPAMAASLKQLISLKIVSSLIEDSAVDEIILQNASTIKTLSVAGLPLKAGTVFSSLEELHVTGDLKAKAIAACPRVKRVYLRCQESSKFVHKLPPEHMRVFDSCFASSKKFGGIPDLVSGLLRLTHLTRLTMYLDSTSITDWLVDMEALVSVFSGFRHLTMFDVSIFGDVGDVNVDDAVAALVNGSQNLQSIQLLSYDMSDRTLQSLAQLQSLTDVNLEPDSDSFTTPGVMQLLTGASRKCLTSVTLKHCERLDGECLTDAVTALAHDASRSIVRNTYAVDEEDEDMFDFCFKLA